MKDPYRYPPYYTTPPVPPPDCSPNSIIVNKVLEPGQVFDYDLRQEHAWSFAPSFLATSLIYFGAPGMWLGHCYVRGTPLFGVDAIPMDSYRVGGGGCTEIDWPMFGCLSTRALVLPLENRSAHTGRFLARIVGRYMSEP